MDILTSNGLTPRSSVHMDMQVNPQREVAKGEGEKKEKEEAEGYNEMPRHMECLGEMRVHNFLTLFTHATPLNPDSLLIFIYSNC